MAVEKKRGCGFRKIGGLYLEGEYIPVSCDRLPLPLQTCPVCGGGIKVGRGMTRVNPLHLWGLHTPCDDRIRPCFVCDPEDRPAFIMLVGEGYYKTPEDFTREAVGMGISKRIAHIPKDFEVGKTVVYLAHNKACEIREAPAMQYAIAGDSTGCWPPENNTADPGPQPRLLESETVKKVTGIFSASIPHRIVQIVKESALQGPGGDKLREDLAKRGITPVPVPDNDPDHAAPGHNNED